jgi:hypothetical protein
MFILLTSSCVLLGVFRPKWLGRPFDHPEQYQGWCMTENCGLFWNKVGDWHLGNRSDVGLGIYAALDSSYMIDFPLEVSQEVDRSSEFSDEYFHGHEYQYDDSLEYPADE